MRVRLPGEAELAGRVLGRQAEDVRRGLRQAVALDDLDPARVPRLEQRLGHRGAADDCEPQAREIRASRSPSCSARKRYVAGTPIIVVTPLLGDQLRARAPGRTTARAPPSRPSTTRAAAARSSRRRGTAAAPGGRRRRRAGSSSRSNDRFVQKQFAWVRSAPFGLPGRARRVDEEQRVVVARRRPRPDRSISSVGSPIRAISTSVPALARELRVLVRDEEERGLGVLELVARSRPERGATRSAGARHRGGRRRRASRRGPGDVRVSVASRSPRRRPRSASPAASRVARAVELGVGQLAAEEADRDAVGREARAVGEPAPDGQLAASHASSRNAETDETNRSGAPRRRGGRVPGNALEARIRKELDEQVGVPRVDDDVLVAVLDERRRRERSEPVVARRRSRRPLPARPTRPAAAPSRAGAP